MELAEYQKEAAATDQVPAKAGNMQEASTQILVPLLGLAGEAGEILSEYKKLLRDGPAYKLFPERMSEELGDLLWYISNVASKSGLSLEDVASQNLKKCRARWEVATGSQKQLPIPRLALDAHFPEDERLPRRMEALIETYTSGTSTKALVTVDGKKFGDPLRDNQYYDDGYRFHDIFHLAYASVLGWSPLTRRFLERKRKSKPQVDDVEDGGRAIVIEEGISALVFSYAEARDFLRNVELVDYDLLRSLKTMTSHLEVRERTVGQWEDAILQGFEVWRAVREIGGGRVTLDLDEASIKLESQE